MKKSQNVMTKSAFTPIINLHDLEQIWILYGKY